MQACCFTGHRYIPDEDLKQLTERVQNQIDVLISKGVTVFRSGGALGFDMLSAECVLRAKKKHPEVKLCIDVPHRGQEFGWHPGKQLLYRNILQQADEVNILSDFYYRGCMHARNRHMVERSDYLISYVRKCFGGSFYTRSYANMQGKTVIDL